MIHDYDDTVSNLSRVERLRRLELYGNDKHHPSEEPHRQHANVLVFHMSDVDSVDASYVVIILDMLTYKTDVSCLARYKYSENWWKLIKYTGGSRHSSEYTH